MSDRQALRCPTSQRSGSELPAVRWDGEPATSRVRPGWRRRTCLRSPPAAMSGACLPGAADVPAVGGKRAQKLGRRRGIDGDLGEGNRPGPAFAPASGAKPAAPFRRFHTDQFNRDAHDRSRKGGPDRVAQGDRPFSQLLSLTVGVDQELVDSSVQFRPGGPRKSPLPASAMSKRSPRSLRQVRRRWRRRRTNIRTISSPRSSGSTRGLL
jgi:hypothetical protein